MEQRFPRQFAVAMKTLSALVHTSAYKKKEHKRWIMKAFMGYWVWASSVGINIL